MPNWETSPHEDVSSLRVREHYKPPPNGVFGNLILDDSSVAGRSPSSVARVAAQGTVGGERVFGGGGVSGESVVVEGSLVEVGHTEVVENVSVFQVQSVHQ